MSKIKSNFSEIFYSIAPFVCFILGYIFCIIIFSNKTVKTPNLIGKNLHEAIKLTSNMQINLQLIGEKECPGIKEGNIVTQKPIAGRLIKKSQSILVMISKSIAEKITPNITKLSLDQAELFCKDQQIKFKKYKVPCNLPKDACIGQFPAEKESLTSKKLIAYYAKEHNDFYIMPNFVGQSLSEVTNFLEQNRIETRIVNHQEKLMNTDHKDTIIISQNPFAGSIIKLHKKTAVELTIE